MIKEIIEKLRERKAKYKELDENYRLNKMLAERQKSANERELERYMEEERQARIKTELEHFRNKRKQENNNGSKMMKSKYIFKDNGHNILKSKNIFENQKNLFMMKGNMLK